MAYGIRVCLIYGASVMVLRLKPFEALLIGLIIFVLFFTAFLHLRIIEIDFVLVDKLYLELIFEVLCIDDIHKLCKIKLDSLLLLDKNLSKACKTLKSLG
jgi:hypothetical protein